MMEAAVRSWANKIVEDVAVPGVADLLEQLPADITLDEAVGALREAAQASGAPRPSQRGPSEAWRRLVSRLRGRRLLDDLGTADVIVDVFHMHTPPSGTAAIDFETSRDRTSELTIKAFGLGYGKGRTQRAVISESLPARDSCLRICQHIVVSVRRFGVPGVPSADEICTDVVSFGPRVLEPWPTCPRCGVARGGLDLSTKVILIEQAVDMRTFDTALERHYDLSLSSGSSFEAGVQVALPGGTGQVHTGVDVKTSLTWQCQVRYSFAAGYFYIPYRDKLSDSLPSWALG